MFALRDDTDALRGEQLTQPDASQRPVRTPRRGEIPAGGGRSASRARVSPSTASRSSSRSRDSSAGRGRRPGPDPAPPGRPRGRSRQPPRRTPCRHSPRRSTSGAVRTGPRTRPWPATCRRPGQAALRRPDPRGERPVTEEPVIAAPRLDVEAAVHRHQLDHLRRDRVLAGNCGSNPSQIPVFRARPSSSPGPRPAAVLRV